MNLLTRISSRSYLKIAASSIGAFLLFPKSSLHAAAFVEQPDNVVLRDYIARFYSDNDAVTTIGEKYLKCVPCNANEEKLLELILGDKGNTRLKPNMKSYDQFRETIQARIRQDFTTGQVENLEGWILSKTEVQLCSLVAL